MQARTQSIVGIFLLLLFLYPQAQKHWHDFEHRHVTHCNADAEVHLHPLEHVCDLCDFNYSVGIGMDVTNYDVLLNAFCFSYIEIVFNPVSFSAVSLPARSPPFV